MRTPCLFIRRISPEECTRISSRPNLPTT
uniref:Uncharacterized protein n=1 Tax=Triticum urartu TaxID=4572 RepID=A0A8R7Q131_TRIUA